jgi:NTE family protein
MPVAEAVRASMSIPLFFEPRVLRGRNGEVSTLVDGGVLSNFPVEVFDRTDGRPPRWPTFGVKVIPELPGADAKIFPALGLLGALPPIHLLEQVLATAIVGHDQTRLDQACVRQRIIDVDTAGVGIVEFGASTRQLDGLVSSGRRAAEHFLAEWSWEGYLTTCR